MKALTDTFTRARPNERSLRGNNLKFNDFVFQPVNPTLER